MIEAGANEIGIILGPNKDQVIETVRSVNWEVPIKFIYPDEPKDLLTPYWWRRIFWMKIFVMYLGDNILP